MQFTQPAFLIFVAIFFLGWRLLRDHLSVRLAFVVAASFYFYSYKHPNHLWLLLGVILASFFAGRLMIAHPKHKRLALGAGILLCLAPLPAAAFTGQSYLPGLSFYTLQAVSYLVDVFRGRMAPAANLLPFSASLALFPKLLGGPIERTADLLPQLTRQPFPLSEEQRWQGARWIIQGYFLKVVVADNLAPFVDTAFASSSAGGAPGSSASWWLVLTAFAIQLLGDFGGYSAIAVGLGKWMGLELTPNFNRPYLSTSLGEFWSRWHITLSNWLRDYIFFPLNRWRRLRHHPHFNLWLTFFISGLWHVTAGLGSGQGAGTLQSAWPLIAWGGLHGLFISLERLTRWPDRLKNLAGHWGRLGRVLALCLVLLQTWVAWVFFRSESIPQALAILHSLFSFRPGAVRIDPASLMALFVGLVGAFSPRLRQEALERIPLRLRRAADVAGASLLLVACIVLRGPGSQFIYLQF